METLNKEGLFFFEELLNLKGLNQGIKNDNEIDLERVRQKMKSESTRLLERIRSLEMDLAANKSFSICISAYYKEAGRLLELAEKLLKSSGDRSALLQSAKDHLMNFCKILEKDYGKVICGEVIVPVPLKMDVLNHIARQFEPMRTNLPQDHIGGLVIEKIVNFVEGKDLNFEITRRSLHYKLEFTRRLADWDWSKQEIHYAAGERFLIYINFNSKEFMDMLIGRIGEQITMQNDPNKKLLMLMDYHRAFNQLHRKPGLVLNPGYHSLDWFINNWFENEIDYVQHCAALNSTDAKGSVSPAPGVGMEKLQCNMSADQLAIYLRLIDEEHLVAARSLNQVYQTIVPFLSTKHRTSLSPSSVRVKSYHPEDPDKQKVINALERMAERVRGY